MTTRTVLQFVVPGHPIPKGRPRFVAAGEKVRTITPLRTQEYEAAVGWAYREAHPGGVAFRAGVPVVVVIDVYEGPKQRAGDIDNYEKAILDALNGLAWADDKQVVETHARVMRKHADPRVEVTVATSND